MLSLGQVIAMTNRLPAFTLLASLIVLPALARAQEEGYAAAEPTPDSSAPNWTPPAPPAETPAAPQAQPAAPVPPGQWVYTQQYGWIWMPYADAYTHVPADGWGAPYAYVYYPAYSAWTWVAAPWVWGYGPWPVFGAFGPARFAWYGHGWWRSPARWRYAPARAWYPGGGFRARSGFVWGGQAYTPSRGGAVYAPFRGGGGRRAAVAGGHAAIRHGGHGRW
jgi:hypothetical protein